MKHTPGPWEVRVYAGNTRIYKPKDDDGMVVSLAELHVRRDGCIEANARLIAAAPELLALLEEYAENDACCGDNEGHSKFCLYCKAQAAIAKATGGENE